MGASFGGSRKGNEASKELFNDETIFGDTLPLEALSLLQ